MGIDDLLQEILHEWPVFLELAPNACSSSWNGVVTHCQQNTRKHYGKPWYAFTINKKIFKCEWIGPDDFTNAGPEGPVVLPPRKVVFEVDLHDPDSIQQARSKFVGFHVTQK